MSLSHLWGGYEKTVEYAMREIQAIQRVATMTSFRDKMTAID